MCLAMSEQPNSFTYDGILTIQHANQSGWSMQTNDMELRIGNHSANIYGLFKCPIKYSSRSCAPFGFVVQSPSVIDLKVVNNFPKLVDDAERIQKVIEERS